MKYTRFEFILRKKARKSIMTGSIVLLIPVIGLFFGYLISQFIITPYFSRAAKNETTVYLNEDIKEPIKENVQASTEINGEAVPEVSEAAKEEVKEGVKEEVNKDIKETEALKYMDIKQRRYITIQAGAFASQENANALANMLNKKNLPSYILNEDEYSRVIVGIGVDNVFAQKRVSDLKEEGYTCLIKEMGIEPKEISQDMKDRKEFIILSNTINSIGDSLDEALNVLSGIEDFGSENVQVKENIKELGVKITGYLDNTQGIEANAGEGLKEIVLNFNKIKTIFSSELDNIRQIEEEIVKCVFIYRDIIEQYNNLI
ncbi:sporulation related domain protein [Oxobacter pfennigii]|uniref:Sporulation related domain protein n=1 Tax=Oxobacter pfennigii TaxID=36849 RepID=A0A0P8W3S7_9CLOT|nr:SPOR domain-containing protein [Oxobacter pfennigii]KPU42252.1 sporulation related domain protein [Oxobacter pfennigii]